MHKLFDFIESKDLTIEYAIEVFNKYYDNQYVENDNMFAKYLKQSYIPKKDNGKLRIKFLNAICVRIIVNMSNYKDVLKFKDYLLERTFKLNEEAYTELIYRMDTFDEVNEIKHEVECLGYTINKKIYINLIKKAPSFDIAKDIYKKLLSTHFDIDVRIHHLLLKKCKFDVQVQYILEELGQKMIIMDTLFYQLLESKYKSNPAFKEIEKSRKKYLRSLDLDLNNLLQEDIETYKFLIYSVENISDLFKILSSAEIDNIKFDKDTLFYLITKLKLCESLEEYSSLMCVIDKLIPSLSTEALDNIYSVIYANSIITGTRGIYNNRCLSIMDSIKKLNKSNVEIEDIFFNNGIIEAYESYSLKFIHELQNYKNEIEELNQEEDDELYKYEILFLKGKIEGLNEKQRLYYDTIAEKFLVRIICFIPDEETLVYMKLMAIKNDLFKATIENINNISMNSFFFTSSIDDFKSVINKINYNSFDINVYIVSAFDSRTFIENYQEEELINRLFELKGSDITAFSFIKIKNEIKNLTNVFKGFFNKMND